VIELGLHRFHLGLEFGRLLHQAQEIRHGLPSIASVAFPPRLRGG
jgi:hypothetical protein